MIKRYKSNEIDKLSQILKNDGVISVPTDTVYGLCASISSLKAYKKLIKIKNRPSKKSFPVMCKDKKQIEEIAILTKEAETIINAFMPGPITIVLKKNKTIPNYITNGKCTIAIRLATSIEIEYLIEKVGSPLFMTSANITGEEPCKSLDEIELKLPLLDGILIGDTNFNKSSTILDLTCNTPTILREGPITIDEINKVLNN